MSKIKLLVEIDEDEYKIRKEMAKDGFDSAVTQMIVNGIPYNPTGDCISREYIESIVRAEFVDLQDGTEEWRTYVNDTCENILNKVDNAPTVEYTFEEAFQKTVCENRLYCPARPQGEWIIVKDEKYGDNVKCPFCGKELAGTDLNFCCKCGADMRGGAE